MAEQQVPERLGDETPQTTFRAWVVSGGRSEWHLVDGATLEEAEAKARKRWKWKLVSVKPLGKRPADV